MPFSLSDYGKRLPPGLPASPWSPSPFLYPRAREILLKVIQIMPLLYLRLFNRPHLKSEGIPKSLRWPTRPSLHNLPLLLFLWHHLLILFLSFIMLQPHWLPWWYSMNKSTGSWFRVIAQAVFSLDAFFSVKHGFSSSLSSLSSNAFHQIYNCHVWQF